MARPWETLDRLETDEGTMELRRRGEKEFLITVAGRVLMSSAAHRSEMALAESACAHLAGRPAPRVLIGGLGMGFTLRAALDHLPADARVVVAELQPTVIEWCRGPLAELTGRAVEDRRAEIVVADVAERIDRAAEGGTGDRYDAILLDLYEGPREVSGGDDAPFYGRRALQTTRAALARGGVFGVWSEDPDPAFERRLRGNGFRVERLRPRSGGPRHVVYLARLSR
ncbi:MAG: spermidine synthase [Acidobacteriota bacterium]|jgi:spermidine synthase